MTDIQFANEMSVSLIDHMGTDSSVVRSARVSIGRDADEELSDRDKGTLRFLMQNRHASPFEHCVATFRIETPIFVAREFMRHRTLSFNEFSGRYAEFEPKFYVPGEYRPLVQDGKPGAYSFSLGTTGQHITASGLTSGLVEEAWDAYTLMLDNGIAREVARNVLPVNTYTSFYATGNLRAWINFLSLRTADDALYEIRLVASEIEKHLEELFPETMRLWVANGRGSL